MKTTKIKAVPMTKKTSPDLQTLINNALILARDQVGAERFEEISTYVGEYATAYMKPLLKHVEDTSIPKLDNKVAVLMCLSNALIFQARETGNTKVPSLSVAAELFREKK